jgi:hypothetical protein
MHSFDFKAEEVCVEQEYSRGSIVDHQEGRHKVALSFCPVGESHELEGYPVDEPHKEADPHGDHRAQTDSVKPLESHFGDDETCQRAVDSED